MKRRISWAFVPRAPEKTTRVLGLYALSAISIDLSALPEKIARRPPEHPFPVAFIGRLAVDLIAQNM